MQFDTQQVQWLEFDLLEPYPHVTHGVYLRHGGVSPEPYATLNLGDGTSDHSLNYKANREVVRKALGIPKLVFSHQNHGVQVERVGQKNCDKTLQADALFTTEKNIGIGVTHADCQGAIFYDPVHEAIAVVHAGWRGLAQNIYGRTLEAMHREIGTQPHNVFVCVGPSLGPDHAEFKNYKQELPQDFWGYQTKPYFFDLWAIARKQLLGNGILEKHIEITETCTMCSPKDFFSYRNRQDTGRNATIVALKG